MIQKRSISFKIENNIVVRATVMPFTFNVPHPYIRKTEFFKQIGFPARRARFYFKIAYSNVPISDVHDNLIVVYVEIVEVKLVSCILR